MEPLYLEDLYIGQRFISGTQVIEDARMKSFAAEFDPQPFHLDESAAQASLFRGLAASGWYTAAVAMRLLVNSLPIGHGLIGMGGDISWPRPTRAGDTLHIECEILEIIPSRSRPNQAVVKVRTTALNQSDEPVYIFTARILAFKKDTGR